MWRDVGPGTNKSQINWCHFYEAYRHIRPQQSPVTWFLPMVTAKFKKVEFLYFKSCLYCFILDLAYLELAGQGRGCRMLNWPPTKGSSWVTLFTWEIMACRFIFCDTPHVGPCNPTQLKIYKKITSLLSLPLKSAESVDFKSWKLQQCPWIHGISWNLRNFKASFTWIFFRWATALER